MVIGEIGRQRTQLGILLGDVASASRPQPHLAAVGLHQQPVSVPLTLESPLAGLQARHRTVRREHRSDLAEVEDLLVLHPVRQPLVAVGLNQRVAP